MIKGRLKYYIPFAGMNGVLYRLELYSEDASDTPVMLKGDINTFVIDCGAGDNRFDFYRGSTGYINIIAEDNDLIYSLIPKSYTDIFVILRHIADNKIVWQGFVSSEGYETPLQPPPYTIYLPVLSVLATLERIEYQPLMRPCSFRDILKKIFWEQSFGNVNYIGFPSGTNIDATFNDGCYYPGKEEPGEAPRLAPFWSKVLTDIAIFLDCQICEVGDSIYFVRNNVTDMDVYPFYFSSPTSMTLSNSIGDSFSDSFLQKWMPPLSFVEVKAKGEIPEMIIQDNIYYRQCEYIPGTLEHPESRFGWKASWDATSKLSYSNWNFPNGIEVSFLLEVYDGGEWQPVSESTNAIVNITITGPLNGTKSIVYKGTNPIFIDTTPSTAPSANFRAWVTVWDFPGGYLTRLSNFKLIGKSFDDKDQEKQALEYHVWGTLENKTGEKKTIDCGLLPMSGQRAINAVNGSNWFNELFTDLTTWFRYTQYLVKLPTILHKLPIPNLRCDVSKFDIRGRNIVTAYSVNFWESSCDVTLQRIESIYRVMTYNGSSIFKYLPYTKVEVDVIIVGANRLTEVSDWESYGLTIEDTTSNMLQIIYNKAYLVFNDEMSAAGELKLLDSSIQIDSFPWRATKERFYVFTGNHKYVYYIEHEGWEEIPLYCCIDGVEYTDYRQVLELGYSIEGDFTVEMHEDGQAYIRYYFTADSDPYTVGVYHNGSFEGPDFRVINEISD